MADRGDGTLALMLAYVEFSQDARSGDDACGFCFCGNKPPIAREKANNMVVQGLERET